MSTRVKCVCMNTKSENIHYEEIFVQLGNLLMRLGTEALVRGFGVWNVNKTQAERKGLRKFN